MAPAYRFVGGQVDELAAVVHVRASQLGPATIVRMLTDGRGIDLGTRNFSFYKGSWNHP